MELHADRYRVQSGSSAKTDGKGVAMRRIRHTAGSGSQRLPPDAEFPKPLPDKPFEPGEHRASRRVFPRPAKADYEVIWNMPWAILSIAGLRNKVLSLCAPNRCWQGPGYIVVALGLAVSVAGGASAQTATTDNRPWFTIVPSVRSAYETNALRNTVASGNADAGDSRENLRVTPGIDLAYRREFGRVAVNVSGSAGYDFNSKFRFLNQSRIDFNGLARAAVSGSCSIAAKASYSRSRFDLIETQADAGSASITQIYDVRANCARAGFNPVAGVTYRSLESSQASFFDYREYTETLGLAYTQPSIGTVTLNGSTMQLRRPNLFALIGVNDSTDVYSLSLNLDRSVSPRIQISAGGGITKANPHRPNVPEFLGASYSAQLKWLPTPRFTITASALRNLNSQGGISATYVIVEDYRLEAVFQLSAKSQIGLGGSRTLRDFRGDDLTPALQPLRADRRTVISARYSYDVSRRLRVGLGLSHRSRKADNSFYNYKSTTLSSSIGANF
jgi:hypothetical protein